MSANDDLERRIATFYASEAPARAPDWVLESALTTIETTTQRRVLIRVPRRFTNMNSYVKLAIAAVAVIAVGAVGLTVLGPGTDQVGGPAATSSASPTSSPSQGPSDTPPPALTETFTSTIHGISVAYPAGWTAQPATAPWTSGLPGSQEGTRDTILLGDTDSPFIALASQALGDRSSYEWVGEQESTSLWGDSCDQPSSVPVGVDRAPGRIIRCPERPLYALVATPDRGYWIMLYRIDDLEWFKKILETVQLDPAGAVAPSPSLAP